MTRQNGFWKAGFRLVRNRKYDNSVARRLWKPSESRKVTWAWAVALADLSEFYRMYGDQEHEVLQPCRDARAWAVAWSELDAYICGRGDAPPMYEAFDPERHLIRIEARDMQDSCGCCWHRGSWMHAPWALCVEGHIRSRHRKRPRW